MRGFLTQDTSYNYDAWRAFDGNTSFAAGFAPWIAEASEDRWLTLDCGQCYILASYKISASVGGVWEGPVNWTIEASNDNSSWAILDTRSNETGWYARNDRYFSSPATVAYRYFRLHIPGSGSYADIAELYLYGTAESTRNQPVIFVVM